MATREELEQALAAQKEFNAGVEETDKKIAALSEKLKGLSATYQEISDLKKEQNEYDFESVRALEEQAAHNEARLQAGSELLRLQKLAVEQLKKQVEETINAAEVDQGKLLVLQRKLSDRAKIIASTEVQIRKDKDLRDLLKEQAGYLQDARDETDNVLGLLGLSSRAYEKSFFAKAEKLGTGNIFKGMGMQLGEVGKTMLTSVSPGNLLAQTVRGIRDNTIAMITAQDQAISSFNRSTGAAGRFDELIRTTREENVSFGVSVEDSAHAVNALHKNLSDFIVMGGTSRKIASDMAVQLDKMGVSFETSTSLMNDLTKTLGMTMEETSGAVDQLSGLALSLGKSQEETMQEFKDSLPVLAGYGRDTIKVFKGVAAAAKATGIATGRLLQITEQFDTYEGAAEAVSGLNAILGGNYLNSLQMVHMSEDQRIRTLKQAMDATGLAFGSLGKFEQKAIAAKMGISDLNEANKLFGGTLAELDERLAEADLTAIADEEKQKLMEAATDNMEKLRAALQSLTFAVQPVIQTLEVVIGKIAEFAEFSGKLFPLAAVATFGVLKGLTAWTGKLTGSIASYIPKKMWQITKEKLFNKVAAEGADVQKDLAKKTDNLGKVSKMSAGSILAMGGAILLLGAGIGLAAAGMSLLVSSFAELTGEQMVGALAAIALTFGGFVASLYFGIPAIAGFGTAAAAAAIPIAAIGVAVTGIGFGIKLALDSFADLAVAFQGISKVKEGVAENLTVLFKTAASLEGGDAEPIRAIGETAEAIAGGRPGTGGTPELIAVVRQMAASIDKLAGSGKSQEVAIYLSDKKVGEALIPIINEGVNKRQGYANKSYPKMMTGNL